MDDNYEELREYENKLARTLNDLIIQESQKMIDRMTEAFANPNPIYNILRDEINPDFETIRSGEAGFVRYKQKWSGVTWDRWFDDPNYMPLFIPFPTVQRIEIKYHAWRFKLKCWRANFWPELKRRRRLVWNGLRGIKYDPEYDDYY